jgi:deoxyribodipyrimidine photo-lyase
MGGPYAAYDEEVMRLVSTAAVAPTPADRIQVVCEAPPDHSGQWVLYRMSCQRRVGWNFALQRAAELAVALVRPLLVVEELRCGGRWDSPRQHRFVLDGVQTNARRLRATGVGYLPLVEARPGEADQVLLGLCARACATVMDAAPTPGLPMCVVRAAAGTRSRVEQVDSHGLSPLSTAPDACPTAHAFRRFLQRTLREHLDVPPLADPLAGLALPPLPELPPEAAAPGGPTPDLARLALDHAVYEVPTPGGSEAAEARLSEFLTRGLRGYAELRNHPDDDATSGLAPYLHHGHISAHQVFAELAAQEGWTPEHLGPGTRGSRSGWWGLGEDAEAFLDQLITWRELGYNWAARRADYRGYESLPEWAQRTLGKHAADPREYVYTEEELEQARTHDALWNAAQRQLVREGRLHNYLRMLWSKKVLEWTESPREALRIMVQLNNRWALDGQDPNSYTGILWTLGRHDRAWGPERAVFGKVRYMSSANTARKLRVRETLRRYAEG